MIKLIEFLLEEFFSPPPTDSAQVSLMRLKMSLCSK